MTTQFFCERAVWSNGEIDFYAKSKSHDQIAPSVWEPITLRQLFPKDEGMRREPTFTLRPDDAQQLMDELWRVGLRPTEGTGSAGSLSATQRHLEDMRKLAFHNTGIKDS
jgi:hypothetical protein